MRIRRPAYNKDPFWVPPVFSADARRQSSGSGYPGPMAASSPVLEPSGRTARRNAGCPVIYEPDLTDQALVDPRGVEPGIYVAYCPGRNGSAVCRITLDAPLSEEARAKLSIANPNVLEISLIRLATIRDVPLVTDS